MYFFDTLILLDDFLTFAVLNVRGHCSSLNEKGSDVRVTREKKKKGTQTYWHSRVPLPLASG